jgi:hypothetical protein
MGMSNNGIPDPAHQPRRLPGVSILTIAAVLVLVAAPIPFATTQAFWPRWIAIMALAWWLPGALLVAHWRLPKVDVPTAGILAIGLGLCWMILVALIVHWLPGPIGLWLLVAAYEIGALALLLALLGRRPVAVQPVSVSVWGWVVALLLLASILRLPGLGYNELHDDETGVLQRAASAIQGADDALARHTKGPGQIAIAMVVYRALGTANEITTRLPFGLMSIGSVLAIALVGRRLFSPTVGFWAGVLLAMNGFALALSRLVQYQPAVLLLSALAVLAAWEFAQQGDGRWLALVAIFSAFGIVLHYEYALLAPALFVLAWSGWKRAPDKRRLVFLALAVGLAGTLLVVASYVPTLLNPRFAKTENYLAMRLGGFGAFNVGFFVEMGTFYNSSYFFFGLMLLTLAGLIMAWRTNRQTALLLTLWFAPFFILYIFIMQFPGTHVYQLMESWSLLAALPLAAVTQSKAIRPMVRWGLLALVAAWLAVSAGYLYLMFFRQTPEYLTNYGSDRVPFYWAPYGKDVPLDPRFGFPVEAGWKAIGTLGEWGCLGRSYATNESTSSMGRWYLSALSHLRFAAMPDLILLTTHLQVRNPRYHEEVLEGYQRVGEVRVRGEPRIEIWAREPLPVPYVTYDLEDFARLFDTAVPPVEGWPDPPAQVSGVKLGDTMVLESARLERTRLAPGDTLHLILDWRPLQSLDKDYKVFAHLVDENNRLVAQWDGFPCLNTRRTSQWAVGEVVRDHILLTIPENTPPGQYTMLAGFYDEATGERLHDQAVTVATVTIR